MNRINQAFQNKKDILSIYFTAGFPKLDDTLKIIRELDNSNVDMIEIGLPFSDPLADGPTIQKSSEKALKNGMTTDLLFNQLKGLRSIWL
jgi:tryptophan synthase alpha chain